MQVNIAIVHHANQLIIADEYANRTGINQAVAGFERILSLHEQYGVPANLNISGTLLESIAWYHPGFLKRVRSLYDCGLLEIVGSCYAQNIMRFFSYNHNLAQLNEQLFLYERHLGIDAKNIKVFWPPERVWDTDHLAPVLRDPRLLNGGYRFVLVDDRVLLPGGVDSPRSEYDKDRRWRKEMFQAWQIRNSHGLVALPIATTMRECLPPRGPQHWERLEAQFDWLSDQHPPSLIGIYADDFEKPAAVGWDDRGPAQFEAFLDRLTKRDDLTAVRLSTWAVPERVAGVRTIEPGTFFELAHEFGAGENYDGWYFDPLWAPYRDQFAWSEKRVRDLKDLGADPSLMELAEKQLLVSAWETAWHTPSGGPHGDAQADGGASPWIKALASHSRHAAVTAEAAYWMTHKDEEAHSYLADIDHDGEEELILKNDKLFAVFSPLCGGRLIYLFAIGGERGQMVIGNPCDDWNLMEELNKYMEFPRNHPGALADVGFEQNRYTASVCATGGGKVHALLINSQQGSRARFLRKELTLRSGASKLEIGYRLPASLPSVEVEFGLSPDYLNLLRGGRDSWPVTDNGQRGSRNRNTHVWVNAGKTPGLTWATPYQEGFGHGHYVRLASAERQFHFEICSDQVSSAAMANVRENVRVQQL